MKFLFAFLLCLCTLGINAQEIDISRYEVYEGDFNHDGTSDYYFHSPSKIIILHGDITIPIRLPPSVSFVITVEKAHKPYFPPTYSLPIAYAISDSQVVARGLVRSPASDAFHRSVVVGPLPLPSASSPPGWDLIAPAINAPEESETGTFDITWTTVPGANKYKLFGGLIRYISDVDLQFPLLSSTSKSAHKIIGISDGSYRYYVRACINDDCGPASSTAKVFVNIPDREDQVKNALLATWEEFFNSVKNNDLVGAKQYLTPQFAIKFEDTWENLGGDVQQVFEQIKGIAPYYIDDEIAIFFIAKEDDAGYAYIHSLTFINIGDGVWKIKEL